jgi:hypothetical protein
VLMVGAGMVEAALGVASERRPLEEVATPLSAIAATGHPPPLR